MLFSGINIVGLAISMSAGILMILLISEINSFDEFHTLKDRIYRVTSTKRIVLGGVRNYASSSIFIGNQIREQVPGVDNILILRRIESADLKTDLSTLSIAGFYASSSLHDVFSFELISGNPQTALSNPNGIILTKSTSRKLFKELDPVGQLVNFNSNGDVKTCTITGVMKDPPMNSHIQFEALVSLNTLDPSTVDQKSSYNNDPGDIYYSYVYLVLNNDTKKEVEYSIGQIMADYNSQTETPITHRLQPLTEIVTGDYYHNAAGPTFSQQKINLMIGLTFIVLLSACFNYTNLSLARALRRGKEVGIRKVTGATRFQVFSQFMVEAIILAVLALVIGFGLFFLFKPGFLSLPNPTSKGYQMFSLDANYSQLLYLLAFALNVGCIAGFLPAMFHSKLSAMVLFNDGSKGRLFAAINLRRVLIVFQFAISIGLIMCTVIVHKQYKFALNYDLGYSTENIVNINIKGDYLRLLENEYAKLSEVVETSSCSVVLGIGDGSLGSAQTEDKSSAIRFLINSVDENYLDMHEHVLVSGSGYLPQLKDGEEPENIIVNEKFLQLLDLGPPQEAIGKYIWSDNRKLIIQGVVKDFVNISLTKKFNGAFAFVQTDNKNENQFLSVKIRSDNITATMEKLEAGYKKLDPIHAFEASFYEDKIAEAYQQQKATYAVFSFLSFLSISIATLGLLGMAVFTTESRIKEISIRKILGAGVRNLLLLLSKGFIVMILIAGLVAIPITFYIVHDLVLNEFLYKTEIGFIELISGLAIVLITSVITICWQIGLAVIRNPAVTLRME